MEKENILAIIADLDKISEPKLGYKTVMAVSLNQLITEDFNQLFFFQLKSILAIT